MKEKHLIPVYFSKNYLGSAEHVKNDTFEQNRPFPAKSTISCQIWTFPAKSTVSCQIWTFPAKSRIPGSQIWPDPARSDLARLCQNRPDPARSEILAPRISGFGTPASRPQPASARPLPDRQNPLRTVKNRSKSTSGYYPLQTA